MLPPNAHYISEPRAALCCAPPSVCSRALPGRGGEGGGDLHWQHLQRRGGGAAASGAVAGGHFEEEVHAMDHVGDGGVQLRRRGGGQGQRPVHVGLCGGRVREHVRERALRVPEVHRLQT